MKHQILAPHLSAGHIGKIVEAKSSSGATIKDELVQLFLSTDEYGENKGKLQISLKFKNVVPGRDAPRYSAVLSDFFTLEEDAIVTIHDDVFLVHSFKKSDLKPHIDALRDAVTSTIRDEHNPVEP